MSSGEDSSWHPSASLDCLQLRATTLAEIRAFFAERDVLEVETPLASACAALDPHLDSIVLEPPLPGLAPFYLQPSPEAAMKRLLASGSGPIYQLTRAFRRGESGRLHNPEFSILEWYRPGWDEMQMMAEVQALVQGILGAMPVDSCDYGELFCRQVGLDPHRASEEELAAAAREKLDAPPEGAGREHWLDLLFSALVEPELGRRDMVFVTRYPREQAVQAALGRSAGGDEIALRFELYVRGIELVNGCQELEDAEQLALRFAAEQSRRRAARLPAPPGDSRLLAAVRAGLPHCAGAALGVDRLLLLRAGAEALPEVMAFAVERA